MYPTKHASEAPSDGVRETAVDALSTLASEHRIAILRALATAEKPLTFSELRERVGIRDTGRFNYHLSKLRERFVHETDDGYDLGHAGERVILAAADADSESASARAEASENTANEVCPVCNEKECNRLIHVHLANR
ncbi:winged helix-turn-helix domain-containing protein [Haladaptatus halobius]|uniref:winged helix-turn-helix domain-containing protein n=1 Tax=Haladaptatus halobius TaxID=2884875 RepID=UPI001D09AA05|nr:winged helix-turn-helix domain-containing protein [Haladaptatus halobius]